MSRTKWQNPCNLSCPASKPDIVERQCTEAAICLAFEVKRARWVVTSFYKHVFGQSHNPNARRHQVTSHTSRVESFHIIFFSANSRLTYFLLLSCLLTLHLSCPLIFFLIFSLLFRLFIVRIVVNPAYIPTGYPSTASQRRCHSTISVVVVTSFSFVFQHTRSVHSECIW